MKFGRCEDCEKPHRPNPNRQPKDTECKCDYKPTPHKSASPAKEKE